MTILAASTGLAFAQSSPAPANQSGDGVSATTPAPTDQGLGSESGNIKGIATHGTNAHPGAMGTTGSGMNSPTPGTNMRESQEKNASLASPAAGIKKEK